MYAIVTLASDQSNQNMCAIQATAITASQTMLVNKNKKRKKKTTKRMAFSISGSQRRLRNAENRSKYHTYLYMLFQVECGNPGCADQLFFRSAQETFEDYASVFFFLLVGKNTVHCRPRRPHGSQGLVTTERGALPVLCLNHGSGIPLLCPT